MFINNKKNNNDGNSNMYPLSNCAQNFAEI